MVAGALLVAVLALLVERALTLAERLLDPMRKRRGSRPALATATPGGDGDDGTDGGSTGSGEQPPPEKTTPAASTA